MEVSILFFCVLNEIVIILLFLVILPPPQQDVVQRLIFDIKGFLCICQQATCWMYLCMDGWMYGLMDVRCVCHATQHIKVPNVL